MKKVLLAFGFFLLINALRAQLISGPMLGQVELRTAKIWLEVAPSVKQVVLQYAKKGTGIKKSIPFKCTLGNDFNPIVFEIGGLEVNSTYEYTVRLDGKPAGGKAQFTTKDLWQFRKPAPNLTFLVGSCAYFNEPQYDRPGKPYGHDSTIFKTMAAEKAAFMLWTGDNWYTREVDYGSAWGLWYRPHRDRSFAVLQPFLRAMPHYASWDDHDYGPNNSNGSYLLKEESRNVFMHYWANPSYGEGGEGIYTVVSHSDVDIFLCDDRWWRSADEVKDSINGVPNRQKMMLGPKQMHWLKNALLFSNATFKIIVIGSQVLNPVSPHDRWSAFSFEYNDLMEFLKSYGINGVLFLSGDRHHSEVIKVDRPGTYPLFDITVSPLTSGMYPFSGPELNNPYRLLGIAEKQVYGRIRVSGAKSARSLAVDFVGLKGDLLGQWQVSEKGLKTPK